MPTELLLVHVHYDCYTKNSVKLFLSFWIQEPYDHIGLTKRENETCLVLMCQGWIYHFQKTISISDELL